MLHHFSPSVPPLLLSLIDFSLITFLKRLIILLFVKWNDSEKGKKGGGEEGESEGGSKQVILRLIFYLLVHSLYGHSSHSWAKLKPGARTPILISHMGVRGSNLEPLSTAIPVY